METNHNYQELLEMMNQDLICILATTKTCNVCPPIEKKLLEIMSDYPMIPIRKIFLEEVPEFQGQELIFTVPTIVFFSERKEILRESRFIDFDKIERLLHNFQ